MDEFKPHQVPDPIISPGQTAPVPVSSELLSDIPTSRFAGVKNFYTNNKWYVWAIGLGIVIITALAVFAFRPQKNESSKQADVQVAITAPDTAPSGGEVIYKIKVQNNDPATLVNMDLELVYADGVSYVSSTPKAGNLSGSTFKVPDLNSGQNAVVIVKTVAQGNINDDKKLVARLHYRFSNFNSEFVKEESHTVRLVAADVILDVTGPENTTNAQVVSYDIFYRNNSDRDIDNARIQVTYPDGFEFADSNPKPSLSQNIWNIGTVKPQGTGKISFQGSFKSARPGEAATFKIEFLVLDDNGSFFTQGSSTFTTTISNQPLILEQKLQNGSSNIVKPGDTLSFEITFKNNASVVATGVTVIAQLDSKALDFATIRAESGQVQDGTITWNGSSLSSLERLNPNESGTLKYTVQVRNPAAKDAAKELTITSKVKINSTENKTFAPGNEITLKVSSPAALHGGASFVSGELPPKVGQQSTFQVAVDLRNATNDFGDSVVVG